MKNKYVNYFLASALLCVATTKIATAQWAEGACGYYDASQKLELDHPELAQQRIDYNKALSQAVNLKKKSPTAAPQVYIIPIVFHVIHINGPENISDLQIQQQVVKMNTDWRKRNADTSTIDAAFVPFAKDVDVEFRLAKLDPNGNCTNGIDRIYSHNTIDVNGNSKLNQWPRDRYMNVWVVAAIAGGTVAGYALYPADVATFAYPQDGVVLLYSVCNGSSRVLSHEIGHCFSLEHTFGNTNTAGTVCGDDLVDDTPITKGHLGGCDYTPACSIATMTSPYSFGSVTSTSGIIDTSHITTNQYVRYGHFSANGVSPNSSVAGQFSYTNWGAGSLPLNATPAVDDSATAVYSTMTGALDNTKYYEVTISPDTVGLFATSITISSINFTFQRNSTGARSYAVRSSLDGYASNLTASSAFPATVGTVSGLTPNSHLILIKGANEFFVRLDTTASFSGNTITTSAAGFTNHEGPITFRIYAWNAEDATGSFGIDNFTVNGSGGIVENVQNYMEYASCPCMFTGGQRDRIWACLNSPVSQRNNLWLNSNLALTGTDGLPHPICVPHPDFYASHYTVCPGGTVTFTKNEMYGRDTMIGVVPGAKWTFSGGIPATSTAANPTVTYSTPGAYDVELWAQNSAGKDSVIKTNYIFVSPSYADVSPGLTTENFDNSSLFYSRWRVEDLDNNSRTWWLTNTASFSGSQSVVMNSYYDYINDVDNLYSPSYDLSYVTGATISFKLAAATKGTAVADMTDKLRVLVSKDCGANWQQIKSLTGTALINNGYHPEEFVPNSASQWTTITANIVPTTYVTGKTFFKFEYTSGDHNNDIYIDDINISGTLGVDNSSIDETSVSLYPNPSNESTTLAYHLNVKANIKIELIDILGKKIMEQSNLNQAEGDYTLQISKQDLHLHNGIYFVKVSVDNNSITKKLVITE